MLTIDELKKKILPVAKKHNIEEIYLFGSYARGEATINSDIDLLLKVPKKATFFSIAEFIVEAEETLGKTLDYILDSELLLKDNEYLAENINRDKILLCSRKDLKYNVKTAG